MTTFVGAGVERILASLLRSLLEEADHPAIADQVTPLILEFWFKETVTVYLGVTGLLIAILSLALAKGDKYTAQRLFAPVFVRVHWRRIDFPLYWFHPKLLNWYPWLAGGFLIVGLILGAIDKSHMGTPLYDIYCYCILFGGVHAITTISGKLFWDLYTQYVIDA